MTDANGRSRVEEASSLDRRPGRWNPARRTAPSAEERRPPDESDPAAGGTPRGRSAEPDIDALKEMRRGIEGAAIFRMAAFQVRQDFPFKSVLLSSF